MVGTTNEVPSEPPWERSTPDVLLDLLCGNAEAVAFVTSVAQASHVYDDLIDRDKEVTADAIHDLVWCLLVRLPTNPFYRAHQEVIRPVLITGILNWKAATDMETDGDLEELRIAHALRYAIADVLLLSMAIVGGQTHAMNNARRARLVAQQDTWANYLAEHQTMEKHHATPKEI